MPTLVEEILKLLTEQNHSLSHEQGYFFLLLLMLLIKNEKIKK